MAYSEGKLLQPGSVGATVEDTGVAEPWLAMVDIVSSVPPVVVECEPMRLDIRKTQLAASRSRAALKVRASGQE